MCLRDPTTDFTDTQFTYIAIHVSVKYGFLDVYSAAHFENVKRKTRTYTIAVLPCYTFCTFSHKFSYIIYYIIALSL